MSALAQLRAQGNALRKLAKKREAIGFIGRVGMIGDEALEDAFGDFRTFYITFARSFLQRPLKRGHRGACAVRQLLFRTVTGIAGARRRLC
jgi:hypothetical protein